MKTLLTLFVATFFISQTTPEHRAWIDAEQTHDMLTIQGKFANDSQQDATFRYEMVTTKQGRSGSSSSTQAGSFTAPAHGEVSLSNTSINVTEKDTYVIELKIFRADSVYLHDKIEH
ncbi:MAG: curli-like amyloid fiber formation chaperone CsgH [Tunicatimonas sp.]